MNCPHCGQRVYFLTEHLGKPVRCPGCRERFIADAEGGEELPLGNAPVSAEGTHLPAKRRVDFDDSENKQKEQPKSVEAARSRESEEENPLEDDLAPSRKGSKVAWRNVRTGLILSLVTTVVGAFVAFMRVLGFAVITVMFAAPDRTGAHPAQNLDAVVGIVWSVIDGILDLASAWFYLKAPQKTRTKGLAIAILVRNVALLLLAWARAGLLLTNGIPPPAWPRPESLDGVVCYVRDVLTFLGGFLSLLFLRAIAVSLRKKNIAATALATMVVLALACVAVTLMYWIGFMAAAVAPATGPAARQPGAGHYVGAAVGACCLLVAFITPLGVLFIILLGQLLSAVNEKLGA